MRNYKITVQEAQKTASTIKEKKKDNPKVHHNEIDQNQRERKENPKRKQG
jgi:hypothetical protein